VYVVHFFESVFDRPPPPPYHLHIHLIPRTKNLAQGLRSGDGSTIDVWSIHKLRRELGMACALPPEYEVKGKQGQQNAANLMTYLRDYFQKLYAAK